MSSDLALRVSGLGKRYRLGEQRRRSTSFRDFITQAALQPFRRMSSVLRGEATYTSKETLWALQDVSFEVPHGQVVGIVGRNGAGKSTLLKLLSRISEPTTGRAEIRGRLASLLEVGTGFHPDLTGRENIFLNGAILGMRRSEILAKLDAIVAFAEVERFLDTQVKHYSSGMYLRLAFAVAAHLEPEILLVDEVLAVGDAAFQRKCLGKMDEVASAGRTVVFVSHNMEAMHRLCQRCLWIDGGRLAADGPADEVISRYLAEATLRSKHRYKAPADTRLLADGGIRLLEAEVFSPHGESSDCLRFGEGLRVRMLWEANASPPEVYTFLSLFDSRERRIFAVNTALNDIRVSGTGLRAIHCQIPAVHLVPGDYTITIGCYLPPKVMVARVDHALRFSVLRVPVDGIGPMPSIAPDTVIAPPATWGEEISRSDALSAESSSPVVAP